MRKIVLKYLVVTALAFAVVLVVTTCDEKVNNRQNALTSLTTIAASNVTASTATLGGNIINVGEPEYNERGVVYDTTQNPTSNNKTIISGEGTGIFSTEVSGLTANTLYYVRAYAVNEEGTAYGEQVSFKTDEGTVIGDERKIYSVDISEETDWDLMIVGIEGQSVFLNIDTNTEIPTQLFCKPSKNNNAGFSVFFKENGLPETMVVDGYVIYFGNFRNKLFDFALIYPDKSIEYYYNIESDIDWDDFLESSISTRIFKINLKKVVSAVVNVAKATIKIAAAVPLFTNPITAPAGIALVLSSAPDLLRFADDLAGSVGMELPLLSEIANEAEKIGTALNCGTGNLPQCVIGLAGIIYNEATDHRETKESKAEEISQAEAVMNGSNDPNFWKPQKGDVYVAGTIGNFATVWKNGVAQNLTDDNYYDAVATSVFVSGNDVYVAGYTNNRNAKLWKNGVAQNLTDGNNISYAFSVYVSGNDVYVAGWQDGSISYATVWKNGMAIPLYGDNANSVFVLGNDVYVAGYELPKQAYTGSIAKLWKNGVAQNLTDGTTSSAEAHSVYVSGSDVYVAGYDNAIAEYLPIAKVWKNGVAQNLSDGAQYEEASSIYVNGNDVYVTGGDRYNPFAKLWKNGVVQNLTNGTFNSGAESVYVSGNDVYVAGWEQSGNEYYNEEVGYLRYGVAKLWKNGAAQNLTNGNDWASANSVFVVE